MSNVNMVTWSLALIASNSAKIDAVNRIIIGDVYCETGDTKPSENSDDSSDDLDEKSGNVAVIDFDAFKAAAKATKDEFGNDFAMDVLKATGLSLGTSLARSLSKVDEADYADVMDKWSKGPQESDDLDDGFGDDDGFSDDDDKKAEVTAEAVSTALKAYAKETGRDEAKALMAKYKVKSLAGVSDLNGKQLADLFAEIV